MLAFPSMAKLSGRSLIGFREGTGAGEGTHATDPVTGQRLQPGFIPVTAEEVALAVRLAAETFYLYQRVPGRERGALLRKIAAKIESIADDVIERAAQETALPQAALQGKPAPTCAQLRLFAQVAEEGSWVQARIDRADPDRKPAPKPDIRSMLRPLGPVVVFGASNFPLAFSVAGGDTASALAAGNTVIFKAHPAHPGTSELVGRAIQQSVRECNLPEGIFSLLFDTATQVGTQLLKHPLVKAGAFTGSRAAGRILMDVAASRPEPIPFYAEMSSTNPVFILPGALRERSDSIAAGLHTSFTMGAGQFCTKPGMVFLPQGNEAATFADKLRQPVVDEHQKLDLGRAKIHHGGFEVGFKLNALQHQAIQIHASEVAGLEAKAVQIEFPVPVIQVLFRVLQHRFSLQQLHERIPQVKHQTALLVDVSRCRDGGGFLGLVAPQLPLMLALVQVADTGCFHDALERTPDSKIPADLDAIRRQSEVRVGTKVCRDLGRPGFIDI